MKKVYNKKRKGFLNWLLYGYLIEFVEKEMAFQILFIENDIIVSRITMYVVPQIGSKVEVNERLFLIEDIIYSSHGSANKLIGKFVD